MHPYCEFPVAAEGRHVFTATQLVDARIPGAAHVTPGAYTYDCVVNPRAGGAYRPGAHTNVSPPSPVQAVTQPVTGTRPFVPLTDG